MTGNRTVSLVGAVLAVLAAALIVKQRQQLVKARRDRSESEHALQLSQQELAHGHQELAHWQQELAQWQATHPYTELDLKNREKWARRDNSKRAGPIISGKVAEHLAAYLPGWPRSLNPHDARWIGAPVDYVVFGGLKEAAEVLNLAILDVKAGNSQLNAHQRWIRDAINNDRVEVTWREIRPEIEVPVDLDQPERPEEGQGDYGESA